MDTLADNYKFLVVDNEAGMEHISRVTTQHVDVLYVISDPSRRSVIAASRIAKLAQEMNILRGPAYLILSMVRGEAAPALLEAVKKEGLELAGILPDDEELADCDLDGKPTSKLPAENPVIAAAFDIFDRTLKDLVAK
jgi:CO dehydrogenase maturation factor